jgi:rare lipoprotein A
VRVNDRGPFVPDRILDLSYRAALDLAIVERGVAPVAIEVVSASSGTPARVGAPDSPAAMPVDERRSKNSTLQARRGGNPDESMPVRRRHESPQSQNVSSGRLSKPCFAIQVGAFSDSERARIVSERLKADFPAADVRLTASGSQHLYRVRAGRFQSRAEAETACTHLMKNGYPGAIIVAE